MIKTYFHMRDPEALRKIKPPFGYNGFGETMYYRTYSRVKPDKSQENYHDTVFRVINGVMTIKKDWHVKNYIHWDEEKYQKYAMEMAKAMCQMHWMPPGRGMWAMGTQFIYERGSMSLFNCGFTKLGSNDRLGDDYDWLMDALMCGVGVGFESIRDETKFTRPKGSYRHVISDDREGWAYSVKLLINSYLQGGRLPIFVYDEIRKKGMPIKGFGGTSSGPEPLKKLHDKMMVLLNRCVIDPMFDIVRFKTDVANLIAQCVVAGNVRRSAQLAKGQITDQVFMNLKDYDIYPDREGHGGMSNNSVTLYDDRNFEHLGEIARRVIQRGEPGYMNLRNFKYGRLGKYNDKAEFNLRDDEADGLNPCGEITIEDKELCNVVETGPTKCETLEQFYKACEYATFYASTVSLLPTHRHETNKIMGRNRRIGVGIVDWTGWIKQTSMNHVIKAMRIGYKIVRKTNLELNHEAGVPPAIKVTTIKPGGTIPKLMGKTPGIGYPTFKHTLRRFRIAVDHPICKILNDHNVPHEPEYYDPTGTMVYEFPIIQGPAVPAEEVSLWEQFTNLVIVQREWADNAVSNTIYFKPKWVLKIASANVKDIDQYFFDKKHCVPIFKEGESYWFNDTIKVRYLSGWYELFAYDPNHEEDQIEKALGAFAPVTKSASLLNHTPKGAYKQMPEEGITESEFNKRLSDIKLPIDWSTLRGSDGQDEKFCTGASCEIRLGN